MKKKKEKRRRKTMYVQWIKKRSEKRRE